MNEIDDIDKKDLFELYTLTRKDRDDTRLAYDVLSDEYDDLHRSYKDVEKELEELQIALMKILCVSIIQIGDPEESYEERKERDRQRALEALDSDPIIQKHIQIGFDIHRNKPMTKEELLAQEAWEKLEERSEQTDKLITELEKLTKEETT